tara:strand:- start:42 stop:680 length:639 start_codon:yes stop_codon:yes gene_type:complete
MESTFLQNILEKLKFSSKSIKNKSLFTNQVFHFYTNNADERKQVIFNTDNTLFVISNDGKTYKGEWKYLPEYSGIIVNFNNEITTYKHSFLNRSIFLLNLANSNQIDIYVNEQRFLDEIDTIINEKTIKKYLEHLVYEKSLDNIESYTCLKCEEKVPDNFEYCWNCGINKKGDAINPNIEELQEEEKEFPTFTITHILLLLATLFFIIALLL